MTRLILAAAAASLFAAAGCAPTATTTTDATPGGPSPCFYADRVSGFQHGPSGTVYIRGDNGTVFELTSAGSCRDIDHSLVFGLESFGGVSSRLCRGDWAIARLAADGPSAGPCRVQVTRSLTAADLEALPERYRP